MQRFEHTINDLTDKLDTDQEQGASMDSSPLAQRDGGGGSQEDSVDSIRKSLFHASQTCDLLMSKLTRLPNHATVYNDCWKSVSDAMTQHCDRYTMWKQRILDRLSVVKSKLIQQLEQVIERPVLQKQVSIVMHCAWLTALVTVSSFKLS